MAEKHIIKVTITDGSPSVDQNEVVVRDGEEVKWAGPKRFRIDFNKHSPFAEKTKTLSYEEATRSHRIPEGTERDQYRYSVIPEEKGKNLDPVIIVADPSDP